MNTKPQAELTPEAVRAAGGIVHSDGNIFFTNINQLRAVIAADRALRGQEVQPQVLAGLRHAYKQLVEGVVKDQKAFADGLIAPVIRRLELAQPAQPVAWVGLTQADKDWAYENMTVYELYDEYADLIEQRLREKNAQPTPPASPWQPIETAPEEGEWALVYDDGAMNCAYVKKGSKPEDWTLPQTPNVNPGQVTHWMPLPPPPAGEQQ